MAKDMNSMREDAIRRAKEMYRRAVPQLDVQQVPLINQESKNDETAPAENTGSILGNEFLDELFKDKERMMILALLVILSQEEGNNALLFSLMYLLI